MKSKSKRALRRHYRNVKKKKYARMIDKKDDPKHVGYALSTHNCSCSCVMCGNPRKYFNELTLQERKANERRE